jgi:hypothetical protein
MFLAPGFGCKKTCYCRINLLTYLLADWIIASLQLHRKDFDFLSQERTYL